MTDTPGPREPLRHSPVYTPEVIAEIQDKAELGRYRIRGFGTLVSWDWYRSMTNLRHVTRSKESSDSLVCSPSDI